MPLKDELPRTSVVTNLVQCGRKEEQQEEEEEVEGGRRRGAKNWSYEDALAGFYRDVDVVAALPSNWNADKRPAEVVFAADDRETGARVARHSRPALSRVFVYPRLLFRRAGRAGGGETGGSVLDQSNEIKRGREIPSSPFSLSLSLSPWGSSRPREISSTLIGQE